MKARGVLSTGFCGVYDIGPGEPHASLMNDILRSAVPKLAPARDPVLMLERDVAYSPGPGTQSCMDAFERWLLDFPQDGASFSNMALWLLPIVSYLPTPGASWPRLPPNLPAAAPKYWFFGTPARAKRTSSLRAVSFEYDPKLWSR